MLIDTMITLNEQDVRQAITAFIHSKYIFKDPPLVGEIRLIQYPIIVQIEDPAKAKDLAKKHSEVHNSVIDYLNRDPEDDIPF